jgi:flagellar biosynthesis/type III secretory pathway M-ring protein FliF/YscJ
MIKMMNPWDTNNKTQVIHNHMRERMLSQAMTRFFPGVSQANVLINSVSERRIGASLEPSASIQITTRGGERNTRALVEGVASTVAIAVPGLKRSNVSIVIDGRLYRPNDPNEGFIGEHVYERIAMLEKIEVGKIAHLMPPDSLIAVKVDLESSSSSVTSEEFDDQKTLVKEESSETVTQESNSPSANVVDPGATTNTGANQGLDLSTPPSGPSSVMEKTKVTSKVLPTVKRTTQHNPAGDSTVVSAAVRIPRSHFVRKFKSDNPSAKEPDDAALQPLVDQCIQKSRTIVQLCADIKSPEAVSIDMYDDFDRMSFGSADAAPKAAGIGAMVSTHGKELVLGVLAVISLFMVSMIVRKGPQPAVIVESPESSETPNLATAEDLAGIVGGEASATLDAMELDEQSLKAQQVVQQVSTMVKEDPEAAANLVKRWLNRS